MMTLQAKRHRVGAKRRPLAQGRQLLRTIPGHYRQFTARRPKLIMAAKFTLVFGMFWLICWQRLDPDFGWHLQAGRYIAAHGIPGHDIYSYVAGQFPWIDHEWGYDVLLAHLYNLPQGWLVLTTIFATLWTSTLVIADRKASAFTLLLATLAMAPYTGIRPTVVTLIFFISLLKLSRLKSKRVRLVIPLMFLVWANLHGGLIIGLLALIYFACRDRSWLWVLAASILITFINPYGPGDYVEIFRTVFDGTLHFQITEWYYFTIYAPARPYLVLWLCGFWLFSKDTIWSWCKRVVRRKRGGAPIGDTLVGPFMLAFAMSATRNLPLFVLGTTQELGTYFKKQRALLPSRPNKWSVGILTLFGLIVIWSVVHALQLTYRPLSSFREDYYPNRAVSAIKAHGCGGGNVFNSYDYGGYLIWKLPEHKIYIDGRMPSWRNEHGQKYMDDYLNIFKDQAFQKQQFKTHNIRCAVLENGRSARKLTGWLEGDGWQVVLRANGGVLLRAP